MTGVWLGLGAALTWGVSDYFAQPAARQLGSLRAVFYAQLIGALLLLPYVLFTQKHYFPQDWQDWVWLVLAALLGTGGGLAFYQSANLGNLAVVAPIMGSYGAVTTLLAWWWGEELTPLVVLGLALALVSVVLVSIPARAERVKMTPRQVRGVVWALLSACLIGACFFLMGREITPRLGGTLGTWWIRVLGIAVLFVSLLFMNRRLPLPEARDLLTPGLSGGLSTAAILLTALGLGRGEDAVVTVLGSMSIVITTILALLIVKEKLTRTQWAGVLLAGVSVVLIGLR